MRTSTVWRESASIVTYEDNDSDFEISEVVPFGIRHLLTHERLNESELNLGDINGILCSQWLTNREVVFGTDSSSKLMVYNVATRALNQIPSLGGGRDLAEETDCIINSVQLNTSKTLLAANGRNPCDIAIFETPTLKPVCISENVHTGTIRGMCWLDDEFLVSGAADSKMALWKTTSDILEHNEDLSIYDHMKAISVKNCKNTKFIRALDFNKSLKELAVLGMDGFHIWNTEIFRQKFTVKLPLDEHVICMAVQDPGLYAVGSWYNTLLLDSRTLHVVKEITYNRIGCGINSASFQNDILTMTNGQGVVLFYDLRARKFLQSTVNSSTEVGLKLGRGHIKVEEKDIGNSDDILTVMTHCYDSSGTRLFTAGSQTGPSDAQLYYASLWQ